MLAQRLLLSFLVALAGAGAVRAQTYNLAEGDPTGSYARIELALDLTGQIMVRQNGKETVLKTAAQAKHEYLERILSVASVGLPDKAARFYQRAEAKIGDESRRLRPARALMVAQRLSDQVVTYALNGLLTREEVELTEHFDTLALPGLLPGKEVEVGATWSLTNAAAQALCDLDGLTGHDLVGKLDAVQGDIATLSISGTASGIDLGAAVKLKVTATAQFDLKARRIVAVEWKQDDEREQGPVSPMMKALVFTSIKRTPIGPATELDDFTLFKMPPEKTPPEHVTQIGYADPKGRFRMIYSRDWYVVGRTDDHVVLRLLDRGDFVAQATVAAWKKADPGKHLTSDEFLTAMAQTPGWSQDKVVEKAELKSENANWIYRIAATGAFDGEEAVQYFYLVAGPEGHQAVLTFTMTPKQAQKLESRDLALVRSLSFATAPAAEGVRPASAVLPQKK